MDVRARHWAVAMLGAVALHCTALIAFWDPSNAGTLAVGTGGVEVSLGPAGAAPGGMVAANDVEEVEPVEPTDLAQPTPEDVTAKPVETVAEVPPVQPQPPVDAVEPLEPEPLADEVEPVEPVEPVQLAELAPPEPERVPPPEQEVVEVPPLPDVPPAKPEPPKPVAQSPVPPPPEPLELPAPAEAEVAEEPAPVQTAAIPGNEGEVSGNTEFTDSGSENATPGGGQPGGPGAYNDLLSAWLQTHHEFPERAQRRKMYGETKVSFTIDRDGNLLSYEVLSSSGYKILDEAALDTLKRASPMPPVPPEVAGTTYSPKITLEFTPPR